VSLRVALAGSVLQPAAATAALLLLLYGSLMMDS